MDRARTPSTGAPASTARRRAAVTALLPYLLAGLYFGVVLMKTEVISWYRIQEMFRFQSFHMYGVLGSAVLTAFVALQLLKRRGARSRDGQAIALPPKEPTYPRYLLGGTVFGVGWALTGACPGPILALVGAGFPAFVLVLAAAVLGTWTYGALRDRLPH